MVSALKKFYDNQKKRLQNVGNVYSTIFTGKTMSGQKTAGLVTAKGNKNLLTTAAEHPFITAGVVTAGVMAVKSATAVGTASALTKTATTAGTTKTATLTASALKNAAVMGGLGFAAGALFSGSKGGAGGSASNVTNTYSTMHTQADQYTFSDNRQRSNQSSTSIQNYSISDSPNASLTGTATMNPTQAPAITAYTNPTQETTPTMETSVIPSAVGGEGGSTGLNPLWILAGIAAVMLINDR